MEIEYIAPKEAQTFKKEEKKSNKSNKRCKMKM